MSNIRTDGKKWKGTTLIATVNVDKIRIGPDEPLALIAGPCVIEDESVVLQTAESVKKIADKLHMPYIFKSSYLKDNRSSTWVESEG